MELKKQVCHDNSNLGQTHEKKVFITYADSYSLTLCILLISHMHINAITYFKGALGQNFQIIMHFCP